MQYSVNTRPLLVLDFDGVIVDSTEECVVTAWNAWLTYTKQTGSVKYPDEVPEPYRSGLSYLRNYVRTAGEYVVLLKGQRDGVPIHSQADYDNLIDTYRSEIKPFADLVFSERNRLRYEDEQHWLLGLHKVYPGVADALKELHQIFNIFVVTGKDRDTVQAFFEYFDVLLPQDRIYDKDAGRNKLSVICSIAEKYRGVISDILFIDDNVHHVLPLYNQGCRTLMAEWGYHTDEHLRLAQDNGLQLVSLDTWVNAVLKTLKG